MKQQTKSRLRTLIGIGIVLGGIVGWSFLTTDIENRIKERRAYDLARSTVEHLLDTDGIKGLSDNEMKRFYDETGISPYTHPFNSLSRKDLEQFLSHYELKRIE